MVIDQTVDNSILTYGFIHFPTGISSREGNGDSKPWDVSKRLTATSDTSGFEIKPLQKRSHATWFSAGLRRFLEV